jgi:hypothetical protein
VQAHATRLRGAFGDDGRGVTFCLLLDLEHVRWADPMMDFVKPALWIFDRHPEWSSDFTYGYAHPRAQSSSRSWAPAIRSARAVSSGPKPSR